MWIINSSDLVSLGEGLQVLLSHPHLDDGEAVHDAPVRDVVGVLQSLL